VQQGIDCSWNVQFTRLIKDGERVAGAFGYWPSRGALSFQSEVHCHRYPGASAKLGNYFEFLEYTADGMALAYEPAPNC